MLPTSSGTEGPKVSCYGNDIMPFSGYTNMLCLITTDVFCVFWLCIETIFVVRIVTLLLYWTSSHGSGQMKLIKPLSLLILIKLIC